MSFDTAIWLAFMLVFFAPCAVIVLADRFGDRAHAWFARQARKARRDIAAWLLAPEGLTVRPLTETETALTQVTVDDSYDELLDVIWRDA